MRLVLVTLALVAFLSGGPRAATDTDIGLEQALSWAPWGAVERSVLVSGAAERPHGPSAPVLDEGVAAVVLAFVPRIAPDSMPLLPDIPERAAEPWRDDVVPVPRPPSPFVRKAEGGQAPPRSGDEKALKVAAPERGAGKFLRPPKLDAQITGNRLALRTGPAKRFASVGSLFVGDQVRITGERRGGYVPVVAEDGQSGWVFHSYVRRVN